MSQKPQPKAQTKLRATPARKLAPVPPIAAPPSDPLPPPLHLSPDAAQVWRETVVHLAARGPVNPADGITLETFVAAVLRQRRIASEIEAAPLMDEEGKLSPLLRYAASTAASVKGLAAALGLNPVARQRLPKAPQKQGGDKWADVP